MSRPEIAIPLRAATGDDLPILWEFLAIAAYERDVEAARLVPFVAAHLAGWQRPVDFGFIAERGGVPIGAVWARQFTVDEEPAYYIDQHTPEITIGVKPFTRGRGIGGMLLRRVHALIGRRRQQQGGAAVNVKRV